MCCQILVVRLIKIILNNVRTETAERVRDKVPPVKFYGLQRSYYESHAKCNALLLATATHIHLHSTKNNELSRVAVADSTRIIKGISYSSTIYVNIVHRMSVNRLQGWYSHGLWKET